MSSSPNYGENFSCRYNFGFASLVTVLDFSLWSSIEEKGGGRRVFYTEGFLGQVCKIALVGLNINTSDDSSTVPKLGRCITSGCFRSFHDFIGYSNLCLAEGKKGAPHPHPW